MEGQDVELILTEQELVFMPLYQRLPGDAMDPVLDDATPPTIYEQGSWGPEEADGLIGPDGPWHNPKPPALRPWLQCMTSSFSSMSTIRSLIMIAKRESRRCRSH